MRALVRLLLRALRRILAWLFPIDPPTGCLADTDAHLPHLTAHADGIAHQPPAPTPPRIHHPRQRAKAHR